MIQNGQHTFCVLAYKESSELEKCIKSVLNQEYKSNVVVVTTTLNNHIKKVADKYNLKIIEGKHTSIGGDFDFAVQCAKTSLVTVAHQDDIYEKEYSRAMVNAFNKFPDASIIFPDYYEIRDEKKCSANANLTIKRILLFPLRAKNLANRKFIKRMPLRFGDAISCPAVTFVKNNVPEKIFECDLTCDIDWYAWEKLSKLPGRFVFVSKQLMGHRISEESTTTEIINSGIRTQEDFEIYKKFWPELIAKIFTKTYRNSEKSNKV